MDKKETKKVDQKETVKKAAPKTTPKKEEVKKVATKKEDTKKVITKKEEPKREIKKPVKKVEKKIEKEVEEEKVREVIVERKSGFNYAEVIVIMIISLIVGGIAGSILHATLSKKLHKDKTVVVSKEVMPEGFDEFVDAYENILNDYYQDVDAGELMEAGINGMLQYLGDDYSTYMDKEVSEDFNDQVEGKYQGIGVEIASYDENTIKIVRVFSDSPAAKAGLKPEDTIISVDGEEMKGKNASDVAASIRKSGKSKITLVIKRGEETKSYTIGLSEVNIDSVATKVFEKNGKKIGYIELSIFANNTYSQFKKKLDELEKQNIDSLIIDVRGNSGGYLSAVTDIASIFLERDKVIYQLDTKGKVEKVYSNKDGKKKYKVVVLMDVNSASASEILAAAMKESYGATLIGTNTFGKGTVQNAYTLKSGATVKYTVQKWLTPKGNWIDKKGVEPDIKVELDETYVKNPSDETDKQLQTALEELSK